MAFFLPHNYEQGKRYPLVIDVHGGGESAQIYLEGGIFLSSALEWQLWAAKGYAVFVPEFRSSVAFGYDAILRDEKDHDLINCDGMDIIAGLDELVKRGIVDNDRVGLIGHSAGGRRANWLTVSCDRFKVVISKEGWDDDLETAMKYPPQIWEYFGGSPLEFPENYTKNSALFHAKNGKTPTLFLMGNPDLGETNPQQFLNSIRY